MGCFSTFLYVPVTPEIISASSLDILDDLGKQSSDKLWVEKEYKRVEGTLSDKASALNNIGFGVGSMIGPIIGGLYTDLVGYQNACNIQAATGFLGSVVFFVFITLPLSKQKDQSKFVSHN